MAENDLAGWVARARNGDPAAFEKVVHATARVVYAQVVASVRDRQKAEDLTQETFVAAWKSIATLRQGEGAISWLLTLARNKVLDALKYERRQKRGGTGAGDAGAAVSSQSGNGPQDERETRRSQGPGAVEEVPDDGPAPDRAAEAAEARAHAVRVLGELPEEYRQVLAMRYLGGADYETIREALGLSDGSLRGILNRGMALLRERMSRMEMHGETRNAKREA